MCASSVQRSFEDGTFVPASRGARTSGAGGLLGVRGVKLGGRLHRLLILLLVGESSGTSSMAVLHGEMRGFRGFRDMMRSTCLVEVERCAGRADMPEGFVLLTDARGMGIPVPGDRKKMVCMRLTPAGRWAAFALRWRLSPFALCVASVVSSYGAQRPENATVCGDGCACHAGVRRTRAVMSIPCTAMMCARKFPECSKTKIMRALWELEGQGMITVNKSMRCAIISPDHAHPLFARNSHVLASLHAVIDERDTLEGASRLITCACAAGDAGC